jgi:hypothetical protein
MKQVMKHVITALFSLFVLTVSAMGQTALFEKANLADWDFHYHSDTPNESVKVNAVFNFTADGVLQCEGKPFGWLATKNSYKNFVLTVDYRYPPLAEPVNSGVFLRLNDPKKETFLPRTVEVQLKHENAGDFWTFHGMKLFDPKETDERFSQKDSENFGKMSGAKKLQGAENPVGQWNSLVIVCKDETVTVVLNGKLVNIATGVEQVAGKIAFQSEGGKVEFRSAVVRTLP